MRKYGGFIPGIRPGKRTAEYIDTILTRITLAGAIYLALVAILPEFLITGFKVAPIPFIGERLDAALPKFITEGMNVQFYFGGTSLLIVVGVAMDTVQQVESQLIMRHYDGFMKKTRDARAARLGAAEPTDMALNLVMLGPPGAGKGTQAKRLRRRAAHPAHLDRRHAARGGGGRDRDRARAPRRSWSRGELVSDEIIIGIVRERLAQAGCARRLPARRLSAHGRPGDGARHDDGGPRTRWSSWTSRCRTTSWCGG